MPALQTQPEVRRILAAFAQPDVDAAGTCLTPYPAVAGNQHLFATDPTHDEGHFIVLDRHGKLGVLTREVFQAVVEEGSKAKLGGRWNIHAALATYTGVGIVVWKWRKREFERIVIR